MRTILLCLGLCHLFLMTTAQDLPIPQVNPAVPDSTSMQLGRTDGLQVPVDSLPRIYMRVMPSRVILSLASLVLPILPGTGLFLGWHAYTIQGKIKFTSKAVKPYFTATRDQKILNLYQRHRQARVIWYAGTAGGVVVAAVGGIQFLGTILDPSGYRKPLNTFLLGSGIAVGGQIARFVSFRQLRRAVNLYNHQYAVPPKRVGLHLGLPSDRTAGGAIYLRF